jgi:hypothetical protein
MPRYYFHLYNDINVPDDEGEDLPDLAAAQAFARREARVLAGETVKQDGRITLHHRIDIENEQRSVVGAVHFRDVVHIQD